MGHGGERSEDPAPLARLVARWANEPATREAVVQAVRCLDTDASLAALERGLATLPHAARQALIDAASSARALAATADTAALAEWIASLRETLRHTMAPDAVLAQVEHLVVRELVGAWDGPRPLLVDALDVLHLVRETAGEAHAPASNARAEALSASLALLAEAGVVGFMVTARNGAILEANDRLLEMLGYAPSEIAPGALRWDRLTPDEWRDANAVILHELATTGRARPTRKEYVRKDGSRVAALVGGVVIDEQRQLMVVVDLSNQQRAEEALVRSERLFRAVVETSPDALGLLSRDGTFLYSSPAAAAFAGRPGANLVGRNVHDLHTGEDIEASHRRWQECLDRPGVLLRHEVRLQRPDGVRYAESLRTNFLDDPNIGAVVSILRDITHQRSLETQLGELGTLHRAVFDVVGALVVVLDREGHIVLFNPACERLTSWSAAEVVGKPFFDLFVPLDQREGTREVFRSLRAGSFPSWHSNDWLTRDGQRRWIAWANSCVLDEQGEVKLVIGTGIDRTVERRIEIALQSTMAHETRSSGRDLVDAVVRAVREAYGSRAALAVRLTGEAAEVLAVHGEEGAALPQPLVTRDGTIDVPALAEALGAAGWANAASQGAEDDGRYELLVLHDAPIEESPLLRELLSTCIERIRVELARERAARRVRELNATLEQRVAARTVELEAAVADLESFAYSVSHDLRGPLRAIDGLAHILVEDHQDALGPDAPPLVARLTAAVGRMSSMLDGLLRLARASRGPLVRTEVDLSEIAQEIVDELRGAEPGRHVEVEIAPGMTASADASLARVVLANLVSNAWKYSRTRAVAHLVIGRDARDATFFVRDDGVGFDPAHKHQLFQPFYRLHDPSAFPGDGIGLATVQRIIRRHRGWIDADGRPDAGATIRFSFGVGSPEPSPG